MLTANKQVLATIDGHDQTIPLGKNITVLVVAGPS